MKVTLDINEGEGLRWEWYYKEGAIDGVSMGWYPNGQLKHKVHWKDGKAEGLSIEWHENGQIREKGIYDLNEKGQIPRIRLDEDGDEIECD